MGWRSKILLLMIVYLSGFVSAVYYVASEDENYQANDKAARIVETINHYKAKASEKMSQIDKEDFQTAYSRGLEAFQEMKDKYDATAQAEPESE